MPVGQVIRSHSNIYYVLVDGREVECRPRGRFRLDRQMVLAGDLVEVHLEEEDEGRIEKVLPRRSELSRPAVANVDQAVVVFTLKEPESDLPFLDRVLVHTERAGVPVTVVLNKLDLVEAQAAEAFRHTYADRAGYPVIVVSAVTGEGLEGLRAALKDRVSVLAGHSGVGKSKLSVALEPARVDLKVGELSAKLGRGKHTTRHVELIPLSGGGLLADAPGFTYLEFTEMEKQDLAKYFREFRGYEADCRFTDCMHRKEPDCAIQAAVAAGEIARSRYQNYLSFLSEVEALKRW